MVSTSGGPNRSIAAAFIIGWGDLDFAALLRLAGDFLVVFFRVFAGIVISSAFRVRCKC
jgi:hypothetical protein